MWTIFEAALCPQQGVTGQKGYPGFPGEEGVAVSTRLCCSSIAVAPAPSAGITVFVFPGRAWASWTKRTSRSPGLFWSERIGGMTRCYSLC